MRRWMRYLIGVVSFAVFFLSAAGVGAVVAAHYYGPDVDLWRIRSDLVIFTVSASVSYWCLHVLAFELRSRSA